LVLPNFKKMNNLKNTLLILALLLIAILNILIYWNFHLYYQAKAFEDNDTKIRILKKSHNLFPLNDLVFFEKGRAYFDLALENFSNTTKARTYLQNSIDSFNHSLRINPASYFAHFNLAQSLLHLGYILPSLPVDSFHEYKKAAKLAGENSQIYFEVAKVFLSQWPKLSDENKNFTINILGKIVSKKDRQKFRTLLFLWDMNLKDYDIIEKIMPEDSRIYRIYAEFLGEKSLSLQERQKYLAEAEFLDYIKAKKDYENRQYELAYLTPKKALDNFQYCLNTLKKIKFYQTLIGQNLIDPAEFLEFKKSVLLNMSKFLLEQGRGLTEIKDTLLEYLDLEDREADVADLESYLELRHVISKKLESDFKNLDLLSLQLLLYFKRNRFRDIIEVGRRLQQSFVVVPKDKQEGYVKVLQIVGDAFHKVDFIYDAHDIYQKALEIDPDNLETLIRIRRNYIKLNSEEKIREIDKKIESIISPRSRKFNNNLIAKGGSFYHKLIFDGRDKLLELHFEWNQQKTIPLISIYFNGRVIWEDYLNQKTLVIPVESKIGKNTLQIEAVNRPIIITSISWEKR